MITFTLSWWQLLIVIFVTNLFAYLFGTVVGKQQMMGQMMGQIRQQMPGVPPMPK